MMPLFDIQSVSFTYYREPVLQEITFQVKEGEFVAIIGPNGAGKSTLLKILGGILKATQGQVLLGNQPLETFPRKKLAQKIGYVPQKFSVSFPFTVQDVVLMGRYPFLRPLATFSEEDFAIARKAMEDTEVWHLRHRTLEELSGGEKQRVVLASALAQTPRILLLDEPTTALDWRHQVHFYQILRDLQKHRSIPILVVTHDVNLALRFCQRILALKEGRIAGDGSPEQIASAELLTEIYQVPLQVITHPGDGKPVILIQNP